MLSWLLQAEESGIKETFVLRKKKREEREPLLIKKQCSKGRPKVETGGMFGMNKLALSFVWWHWQIELRVWKGDLSLMGNEFKVMEMNVLFEVQKALVETYYLTPTNGSGTVAWRHPRDLIRQTASVMSL